MAGPDAAIPAAPRKTLLEWIDHDDGDTSGTAQPACSDKVRALHAQIALAPDASGAAERLQPPTGLRLAPLG
jgi:hypothetical protein